MQKNPLLSSRVVLVTGASRGIGEAIARLFASHGAAVAVTARTVQEGDHRFSGSLHSTVSAIESAGGSALAVAADLSRGEDRERLVTTVVQKLGPIDILVNNAAITYFTPVSSFDLHRWQLMFDVQVMAPFHLSQLVLPDMKTVHRGWILNISSPAARHPVATSNTLGGGAVYGMCKAALERFSTGLAAEVYTDHIAVNALSPTGLVVTPGVVHHELDKRIPKENHEPVDVMAQASLLLCSREPQSLTGRITYSQELLREFNISSGDINTKQ